MLLIVIKLLINLNWYPKTTFEKGISLTFNWYNENKGYYKSLSKKDILNRLGKKNDQERNNFSRRKRN